MVELVVAERLHKTLVELRETTTNEELWLWMAYFSVKHDEEQAAINKAKRGRR
jgi:hypothetical protein